MDQPRRFGCYEVSILHDGWFEAPAGVLTHIAGEQARRETVRLWGAPTIRIPVNCFLLRGEGGIALIDAGTGTAWGKAYGHARSLLRDLGIAETDVRRVLLTHLHGDHALGLVDGEMPYFPEAEIVIPAADLAHFGDEEKRAATPKARQGGFDIAATLQRLYAGRIRPGEPGLVLPGIELVALPGHTYGHGGYLIHDPANGLLLWGDTLHLGAFQAADPEIGLAYDLDGATAAATRRDILARAVRERWIVSGGHIEGFRSVSESGDGYDLAEA